MEMRPLGQTGLTVSRLGLGLAALGRPGYINLGHATDLPENHEIARMNAHARDVIDAAWAAGVRYFDAARSYGRAEEFLGDWLRERSRPEVIVGSKWGYTYTADWQIDAEAHEIKEHSVNVLNRQAAESGDRLGSFLRLYQIHSATRESGVLRNEAVLNRLAELKDSGLAIGLSVSGPKQGETILESLGVTVNGRRLFDTVQATWNLLEASAGPALARAHEAGVGVIIKEALANGRLTSRNSDSAFEPKRQILESISSRHDTTMDAVALAGVLAQPWVDVVLSGAASVAQMHSNLRASTVNLDAESIDHLSGLSESAGSYWKTRGDLPWN